METHRGTGAPGMGQRPAQWRRRAGEIPRAAGRGRSDHPLKTIEPGKTASTEMEFEKFRLRRFVDKLNDIGELEVHDEPVAMIDLSTIIESTTKATLFKKAGPEEYELVAAVAGNRRRIAAALGVDVGEVSQEYLKRLDKVQPTVEVPRSEEHTSELQSLR